MKIVQLVMTLLMEILPILIGISEIRSLIKHKEHNMSKVHIQHHISLIGLLICFLLGRLALTIQYMEIIHDVIFNSVITLVATTYTILHLRAERKGTENEFIAPIDIFKIIIKKLKELFIWKPQQ